MNFLQFIIVPVLFIVDKCGFNVKRFNDAFTVGLYMPFAIVVATIFTIYSLILFPFAYIYHLYKLISQAVHQKSIALVCKSVGSVIYYMVLGFSFQMFMLLIDPVIFFIHLFTEPERDLMKE